MFEVFDAPMYLRPFVTGIRKGHYNMVVNLSKGIAVARAPQAYTSPVCIEDSIVNLC